MPTVTASPASTASASAGPQWRTVLPRSAVDRHAFRTARRSQTVYHGPVVYAEDPDGRLENASSVLELALLRVFMKPAAHHRQREYRFAVRADGEPDRDRVDLKVSPALLDAMQRPPREPERGVVVPAGERWPIRGPWPPTLTSPRSPTSPASSTRRP